MNRNRIRYFSAFLLFLSLFFRIAIQGFALSGRDVLSSSVYSNSSSGYKAYLLDESDLLSSFEEEEVKEAMIPLTEYGNIAFISGEGSYSAASTARNLLEEAFPGGSASILLIDMGNREIRIQSAGTLYKTINSQVADSITDNIYRYASNGDFGKTAVMAFRQMNAKMEGRFVETPMRWISNFFLAIFLGLLFNFTMLLLSWKQNKSRSLSLPKNERICFLRIRPLFPGLEVPVEEVAVAVSVAEAVLEAEVVPLAGEATVFRKAGGLSRDEKLR